MKFVYFPRWAEVLDAASMNATVKMDFKSQLIRYLRWCSLTGNVVTSHSAREMVKSIRRKGMALRTEKSYMAWCRRFSEQTGGENPLHATEKDIVGFLDHLAIEAKVSPSTQKQALNAIAFMLNHVAHRTNFDVSKFHRASGRKRIPVVLTHSELGTMIYLHVMRKPGVGSLSPLDSL